MKRVSKWDEIKKDEKELEDKVKTYLLKWCETTPSEDEQILAGHLEFCCNYHLSLKKKKFRIGTIILVVSGSKCPYCDVDTLGIYSKD